MLQCGMISSHPNCDRIVSLPQLADVCFTGNAAPPVHDAVGFKV
jgi:hypothetical protein